MKKNVIVTGGAGFIGANIVSALMDKDYNIHIFDNLSTGNKNNLDIYDGPIDDLNLNFRNKSKKNFE